MAELRPQIGPSGLPQSVESENASMPTGMPLASLEGFVSAQGEVPIMVGMNDAAPSLPITASMTAVGVSTWQNNKRVTALWSLNQNRNSWIGVDGIGWKKLINNSDSAIVALTMLASHAREKGAAINYREESDSMVYEIYVW